MLRYVKALLDPAHVPRLKPSDIGIISPYREQATRLSEMLQYSNLTVDTVERFQGSERRVIIITTTRTKKIGFLTDYRVGFAFIPKLLEFFRGLIHQLRERSSC